MRFIYIFASISLAFASCKSQEPPKSPEKQPDTIQAIFDSLAQGQKVGADFSSSTKIETVDSLTARLKEGDTLQVSLFGKVTDVCHRAGCWLRLASLQTQQDVFVSNMHESEYDTAFIGGYAQVFGKVYWEEFSEEDEAHLAEESGNTQHKKEKRKELVMESSGARFYRP